VSNLEKHPAEVLLTDATALPLEILEPRDVPLGGPRAMGVRRTLPQRSRSLIGGWCFVDHYGPEIAEMVVPPHPHTGLQTVSWLFEGDVEHRDSVGSHAWVRPGEVNLMTAGFGIQHSEVSALTQLHGVQLWIALPDAHRHTAPFFEHHVPVPFSIGDATVRVFVGGDSPVTTFSPLLGAQVDLPPFTSIDYPVDPTFEHGILLDTGSLTVDGNALPISHLAYLAPGTSHIRLESGPDATRLIFLGGEPLGEQIIMWWNFIGRSHDEIVAYRDQWQREVIGGESSDGRFGNTSYDGRALPAPELPTVRLKPRG
jgi:redox-sensitive bicupin YhaK (pirin superfamily)